MSDVNRSPLKKQMSGNNFFSKMKIKIMTTPSMDENTHVNSSNILVPEYKNSTTNQILLKKNYHDLIKVFDSSSNNTNLYVSFQKYSSYI